MNLGIVGVVYALVFCAVVLSPALDSHGRLIFGNVALLIPPLAPLGVIAARRRVWTGRQSVFFATIAAAAAMWFIGQVAWAIEEVAFSHALPWFTWFIVIQLCASALPVIALVAAPHDDPRSGSPATVALDISALALLTAFLYWSLIIAPGMAPGRSATALRILATIGPLVRVVGATAFFAFGWIARTSPWGVVYRRMGLGLLLAFAVLVVLSLSAVRGSFQTGSPLTVGWMLPFWFFAWAAATAPASPAVQPVSMSAPRRLTLPRLLFVAIGVVFVVGYGAR